MMNPEYRSSYYLTITTPLDSSVRRDRKFNLLRIQGEEQLCGDFSYQMEVFCPERLTETEIRELTGAAITVRIGFSCQQQFAHRPINGIVFKIRELGMDRAPHKPDIWRYRLEISSWLAQLKSAKECRIYQKKGNTALSIVKELLLEMECRDYRDKTRRIFPERDYCTIYNETRYDFVMRMLQEIGIVFLFDHSDGQHTLLFLDSTDDLPLLEAGSETDHLTSFHRVRTYHTVDGCQLTDFDYDHPPERTTGKRGKSAYRYLEFPGNFYTRAEGEDKACRLLQQLKSEEVTFRGTSALRNLEAGKRLNLSKTLLADGSRQTLIVTRLELKAGPEGYSNSFTAIPSGTPFCFNPGEKRAKPEIIGYQVATVVGEKTAAGNFVDEQGRIRVLFPWDRHALPKAGSAFIRNAMPAAGSGRGFVFNPKTGDSVVVSFEHSDPDRPIAVGRTFSSVQFPPVNPEQHPETSVIQASSGREANSIRFEDKQDNEKLEFQAKKEMKIEVENDLDINMNEDLTILADNLDMTAEGNLLTGNIVTLSGGSIKSEAGGQIANTTGLLVANIIGGLAINKAGANGINVALGMVNSRSGAQTVSAAPLIVNTTAGNVDTKGKGGVSNTGLVVANTAMKVIENTAGKLVSQKADLAILTNTKTESNIFDSQSSTEALLIKDKGEVVINS